MKNAQGVWIGWGLGDIAPKVSEFKAFMRKKFASYAGGLDDSPVFDDALDAAVREMQSRYGLPVTGVINYATQVKMGFVAPAPVELPWLFTVHGTGQPDPLGPGLPADTARAVLDKYRWQPIGNYPAAPFPMWPSIEQGVNELIFQIGSKPGKFSMIGYSQGAIVVGQVLKHELQDPAGSLHHRLPDLEKVVFFGNPMRQQGVAHSDGVAPVPAANTAGILDDILDLTGATFQVRDYAHEKDLYADCSLDQRGDDKRAICKIIMWNRVLSGQNNILEQVIELGINPAEGVVAAIWALMDAGMFFIQGATPHVNYNIGPAIDFLRA